MLTRWAALAVTALVFVSPAIGLAPVPAAHAARPKKKDKAPDPAPVESEEAEAAEAPAPPPEPGKLTVTSAKGPAKVYVDGQLVGETPVQVAVASGETKSVEVAAAEAPPAEEADADAPGKHEQFHASIALGGGWADEPAAPGSGYFGLEGTFAYSPLEGLLVGAAFRDTVYQQTYTSAEPPLGGGGPLSSLTVREQLQDGRIFVSYDPLQLATDLVSLDVGLAPRFVNIHNSTFAAWGFALGVDGLLTFHPTKSLHVGGGAGFSAVLTGTDATRSVTGLPKYLVDYRAGIAFDIDRDPRWSVELRWQAQSLVFENITRFYHGGLVALRFAY